MLNKGGFTGIGGIGYQWTARGSEIGSSDAVFDMGIYYNKDFYPFIKNDSKSTLSYVTVSVTIKGVMAFLTKDTER